MKLATRAVRSRGDRAGVAAPADESGRCVGGWSLSTGVRNLPRPRWPRWSIAAASMRRTCVCSCVALETPRCAVVARVASAAGTRHDPAPLNARAAGERRSGSQRTLRGLRHRARAIFEAFASYRSVPAVSLDAGVAVVGRLVESSRRWSTAANAIAFPAAAVIAAARPAALRAGLSCRRQALAAVAAAITRELKKGSSVTGHSRCHCTPRRSRVWAWTGSCCCVVAVGWTSFHRAMSVRIATCALLGTQTSARCGYDALRRPPWLPLFLCTRRQPRCEGSLTAHGDSWTRVNRDVHSPF